MSLNDAVSKTNVLTNIFTNTTPFSQTIFARVSLNNNCEDIITVNLIIEAVVIDEPITTLTICPNRPLTLNAPVINSASYLWQNGQTSSSIVVNQPGTYSVFITTANGCASNKTFIVTAIEPFTLVNIEQSNFQDNNYIQVFTAGNLNLEYSIDGSNFQDSPFFNNLTAGFYTVSIRDKFLCNMINKRVIILDYPRFFTPNGDGFNDFWGIKYLPPQAEINIFDRLGKFIATLKNNQSWDGTYNKENLPSTDYWFTLTIAGEVIIKKHFSLKR
jgi:gliding motility-associated-like protein